MIKKNFEYFKNYGADIPFIRSLDLDTEFDLKIANLLSN